MRKLYIEYALNSSVPEIYALANKIAGITNDSEKPLKLTQIVERKEQSPKTNKVETTKFQQEKLPAKPQFSRNTIIASLAVLVLLGVTLVTVNTNMFEHIKIYANASNISPGFESIKPGEEIQTVLRLHRSNTIGENLAPRLLEAFLKKQARSLQLISGEVDVEKILQAVSSENQPLAIEIHAHGSSTGFKDMLAGVTDISMSSRPIKTQEVQQLKAKFGDLSASGSEHIISVDGLAIILHPSNPVNALSSKQIAMLFSGEYQDWSQVGGKPGAVTICARDSNSGTWDSFKNMVLKKNKVNLSANAQRYESSSELSNLVSNDIHAIGFIGLPYVLQAKALAVSDSENTMAIVPTSFTVATEDYPLSRRLYLYTSEVSDQPMVREFANFALS